MGSAKLKTPQQSKMPATLVIDGHRCLKLCKTIRAAVLKFAQARIDALQDEAVENGEEPALCGEFLKSKKVGKTGLSVMETYAWQTLANLELAKPVRKNVKTPVTVSTESQLGLAWAFTRFVGHHAGVEADAEIDGHVRGVAARHDEILGALREENAADGNVGRAAGLTNLERNFGYEGVFGICANEIKRIDPGGPALMLLFTKYLKVISWYAAALAYEHGGCCVNVETLCSVLTLAHFPGRAALGGLRIFMCAMADKKSKKGGSDGSNTGSCSNSTADDVADDGADDVGDVDDAGAGDVDDAGAGDADEVAADDDDVGAADDDVGADDEAVLDDEAALVGEEEDAEYP